MQYPSIEEYVSAIRDPQNYSSWISYLKPVLDSQGNPVFRKGNNSVVFKMKSTDGSFYALKCFVNKSGEYLFDRYNLISKQLEQTNSPFFVNTEAIPYGIKKGLPAIFENGVSVFLMDWVDGINIVDYIKENINDGSRLSGLAYRFSLLAKWLVDQPFAHGDIDPDNILIKSSGEIVLLDYDNMFVPEMGERWIDCDYYLRETSNYNHPNLPDDVTFLSHFDDFPLVSILLSLRSIALFPELINSFKSDQLLFCVSDYTDLLHSSIFNRLYNSGHKDLKRLSSLLMYAYVNGGLIGMDSNQLILRNPFSSKTERDDHLGSWSDGSGIKYSKDNSRVLISSTRQKNNDGGILEPTVYQQIRSCSILNGAGCICDDAFRNSCALTAVGIPDSVETIGDHAFEGCTKLDQLIFPSNIKHIGHWAFKGCSSLRTVMIPDSILEMGYGVFSECSSIEKVILPKTLSSLNLGSFEDCSALKEVSMPNSIRWIGENAFQNCVSLKTIHLPESITSLASETFDGCIGLERIAIPETVKSIGNNTFRNCSSLKSIDIPESVSIIDYGAFEKCSSIENLVLRMREGSINTYAFRDCLSLKTIRILSPSLSGHMILDCGFASHATIEKIYIPRGSMEHYSILSYMHLPVVEDDQ